LYIILAKKSTRRPLVGVRPHVGQRSTKWGRRLTKDEYALDDHGATRAPVSRHRQYGWNAKEFSDLLGPLRGYLRKQVGRPWDKVWSEITTTLDSRTLTGQHIFDHICWEVELDAWLGDDGRLYHNCHASSRQETRTPPIGVRRRRVSKSGSGSADVRLVYSRLPARAGAVGSRAYAQRWP